MTTKKAPAKKEQTMDIETAIRNAEMMDKKLPFDHICEKYKDQYAFAIINDAKGSVQRHEAMGWKVWDKDKIYESEFDNKVGSGTVRDGYASVPCGIAGDGKPTNAYLMYMDLELYNLLQQRKLEKNRERKSAYGRAAEQSAASSVGGGVETYTPDGYGDGFKHMPNTTG